MAGAKCKICGHQNRGVAEAAIASGASVRETARRLGLPYSSLDRHQRNCVPRAIAKVREKAAKSTAKIVEQAEAREAQLGVDLVGRVERLQKIADQIIEDAMAGIPMVAKDGSVIVDADGKPKMRPSPGLALKGMEQARKNLELIGRLTGTLEPQKEQGEQLITFESLEMLYRRVRLQKQ